ncbi:ABC transporter substrate-binding protein [Paenibacillus sambharensis]|uniref:ABC transporter substrate-binding protein n=1 Tax=Paenibacillus sambharensis TaxID=1803190 RepID=A0A2W1L3L5_9BACL|nr:extracellular solute-binding protein [Paenibacillus sambharensis]PZD94628.1 ABC transporter substrate-binding protein [Paenibacillus sambharensis]
MRNIISLAMIIVLTLTLLSACSGGNNNSNTPSNPPAGESGSNEGAQAAGSGDIKGELVFLTNRTDMVGKQYADYEKRFEEQYPEVDLKFEAIQDYEKNMKIRISSGSFPDVVLIGPGIANAELPKYFAPLDDIEFSGDIWFAESKASEGKMYGVSSGNSTVGIVYNKKAFEQAGITEVPKTWDEFLAAAQKLKDAGIVPLASNFKDKWPLGAWVYDVPTMISADPNHQNERAETDTPYTMDNVYGQSWSMLRELKEKGYLEKDINSTNWEQSKKAVAQGDFAMYLLGNWVINQVIENGAASEDIGFFPFPADNSGELKAPLNPDWFYAVNKEGNVAAAKAFVQWMIEDSGYDEFAGFIPTLKDKEASLAQLKEFQGYNPQMIEAGPPSSEATEIQNKAQIDQEAAVQEFVLAKDPQTILDKLNEQWAKAKKSLGY